MIGALTQAKLEMFLSDELGVTNYEAIVNIHHDFENQCFKVIQWAEGGGRLRTLCSACQSNANTSGNARLQEIVREILAADRALPQVVHDGHVFFIGPRPFLNREDLQTRLPTFAAGTGLERVLLVSGKEATGKSYSVYLISQRANGARFELVEIPKFNREVEAADLVARIWGAFWPNEQIYRFDDLGQQARDANWYSEQLLMRMKGLAEPTWLFIDGFNTATLSPTALDPLVRLCYAIEINQCRNLWLALVGLRPDQLGSNYATVVEADEAKGLTKKDIAKFLQAFAASAGKPLSENAIRNHATELYAELGNPISHKGWRDFRLLLRDKCRKIRAR
jgi:hypothetical protein